MLSILWGLDDDPDGNVRHIAEHGFSKDDVEKVLEDPIGQAVSHSSGCPMAFGYTTDGRHIAVVFLEIDADTLYPITAFETPERQRS